MKNYTQLTESERNQIYALKQAGFKPSAIALQMSRHPSTIYRELRRNRGLRGYRPRQAQQMAETRRRDRIIARFNKLNEVTVRVVARCAGSAACRLRVSGANPDMSDSLHDCRGSFLTPTYGATDSI
jgi:hypothetical protein